jgi:hypothetical protein
VPISKNRPVTLGRRSTAWRPLADLLRDERGRPDALHERLERLELPAPERALLRELLDRD